MALSASNSNEPKEIKVSKLLTLQIESKDNARIGTLSLRYEDNAYQILHDEEMVKMRHGDNFFVGDLIFNIQLIDSPSQFAANFMQPHEVNPVSGIDHFFHNDDPLAFLYATNKRRED